MIDMPSIFDNDYREQIVNLLFSSCVTNTRKQIHGCFNRMSITRVNKTKAKQNYVIIITSDFVFRVSLKGRPLCERFYYFFLITTRKLLTSIILLLLIQQQ